MKHSSIIIDSSYNVSFIFEKLQQKDSKKLPILWILKVPRTLRFSVALRIQPHFHPMPKGNGLSRSERAVIVLLFFNGERVTEISTNHDSIENVSTSNMTQIAENTFAIQEYNPSLVANVSQDFQL